MCQSRARLPGILLGTPPTTHVKQDSKAWPLGVGPALLPDTRALESLDVHPRLDRQQVQAACVVEQLSPEAELRVIKCQQSAVLDLQLNFQTGGWMAGLEGKGLPRAHTCAHRYACMYVKIHTDTLAQVHTNTDMHAHKQCISVCTCVHMCVHTSVCEYMLTQMHRCTHRPADTRVLVQAHTHTHTETLVKVPARAWLLGPHRAPGHARLVSTPSISQPSPGASPTPTGKESGPRFD